MMWGKNTLLVALAEEVGVERALAASKTLDTINYTAGGAAGGRMHAHGVSGDEGGGGSSHRGGGGMMHGRQAGRGWWARLLHVVRCRLGGGGSCHEADHHQGWGGGGARKVHGEDGEGRLGIWDGRDFVLESSRSFWDTLKVAVRYLQVPTWYNEHVMKVGVGPECKLPSLKTHDWDAEAAPKVQRVVRGVRACLAQKLCYCVLDWVPAVLYCCCVLWHCAGVGGQLPSGVRTAGPVGALTKHLCPKGL